MKRRALEHFEGLDILGGARAVRLLTSTCQMLAVATQEGMTSGLAALSPRQPAAPISRPTHTHSWAAKPFLKEGPAGYHT